MWYRYLDHNVRMFASYLCFRKVQHKETEKPCCRKETARCPCYIFHERLNYFVGVVSWQTPIQKIFLLRMHINAHLYTPGLNHDIIRRQNFQNFQKCPECNFNSFITMKLLRLLWAFLIAVVQNSRFATSGLKSGIQTFFSDPDFQ